eukprot:6366560-Prymnesium_polylepis.3
MADLEDRIRERDEEPHESSSGASPTPSMTPSPQLHSRVPSFGGGSVPGLGNQVGQAAQGRGAAQPQPHTEANTEANTKPPPPQGRQRVGVADATAAESTAAEATVVAMVAPALPPVLPPEDSPAAVDNLVRTTNATEAVNIPPARCSSTGVVASIHIDPAPQPPTDLVATAVAPAADEGRPGAPAVPVASNVVENVLEADSHGAASPSGTSSPAPQPASIAADVEPPPPQQPLPPSSSDSGVAKPAATRVTEPRDEVSAADGDAAA